MAKARARASAVLLGLSCCAFLVASGAQALPPEEEPEAVLEEAAPAEPYAPVRIPDDHDPLRAAHPVRVAAYVLHPIGVTLDYVLVRPAVWVVRHEPFRTLFGYQDY